MPYLAFLAPNKLSEDVHQCEARSFGVVVVCPARDEEGTRAAGEHSLARRLELSAT
jgi:hypothetical protein